MIERIVIPVDFSAPSEAAAEYGCALASRLGARVTLLHVYTIPIAATPDAVYAPTPEELRALAHAARGQLHALAYRLARAGLQIDCVAVEGYAAEAIVRAAGEAHADLIVMGTHGRRGLAHLVLGSVAEQVVRTAPCPVLTVGGAHTQPVRAAL